MLLLALLLAAAPTPTPTPVALQYDEISRVIVAPATPPAPGNFGEDYQLAMSASSQSAQPTPPPRRGLGGMIGGMMMPGGPGGGGMPPGAMAMMNLMKTGHLVRYTFYYTKGWIREDDPVAQTATISKCNEHSFITLDLAKKTYVQTSTQPQGNCFEMPSMGGPPGRGAPSQSNAQPGTEDLDIDATSQNLGPLTIDGIATNGTNANVTMTTTNATGSCRNAQFGMTTVTYVSSIGKPRAYCPLTTNQYVATNPAQMAAQGGCKPALHGSASGMFTNSQKLEMYLLMNADSPQMRGRSVGMLTERGHVAWLYRPQADPLFEIPPGFTASQ
ncbi:MAG TPA: hypothetical protein VMA98_10785 [Candidatus Acidoferrales bacterium]|nr:hypothetical protein [Candidatus Acidoferrales bacterium]